MRPDSKLQTFIDEVELLIGTTDDDIHAVAAVGDAPTIGIHVYGADIGTIERRLYDPATGAVRTFVSGWNTPASTE
jgi:3-mercaptopropionate dioxygenase